MKRRVSASNVPDIALEVLDVDDVESNNGLYYPSPTITFAYADTYRIKSNISFCNSIAVVVRAGRFGEVCLCSIEGFEQLCYILLVSFLSPANSLAFGLSRLRI